MRVGGKMWLSHQSRKTGLGYAERMNRRDYERARSSAASYAQSVFTANASLVQETVALVYEQTIGRLEATAKAKTASALTIDTSAFKPSSTSIDIEA